MISIDITIQDYEISSRTKVKLKENLNNLLDLGLEGPKLEIKDHAIICKNVIAKIERDELTFTSKEKRVLTLIPAVLLERIYNAPMSEFKRILQIISEFSSPRRLIISFVKTALNNYWTNYDYSIELIRNSLEVQNKNGNLNLFKLEFLSELLRRDSTNKHSQLILKIEDFSQLNSILGIPLGWTKTEYHSLVLGKYILKSTDFKNEYEYSRELVHSITRNYQKSFIGSLYLISTLIVTGEKIDSIQTSLKRLALDQIGDPSNTPRWTQLQSYNDDQQKVIVKARELLNFWITRDFLTLFFEKCLNDVRRKRFWLQYAKRIKDFKVYTTPELKRDLLKDPRIRGLNSRIKVFGYGRISAIVMNTGKHDLVEFSDDGWAFRAYLSDNEKWRKVLDQRFIESAELLRSVRLPMAVRRRAGSYYDWKKSGTLHHRDATYKWESTFKSWLERTAL